MSAALLEREEIIVDQHDEVAPQNLQQALRFLDIRPFNDASVERYKRREAFRQTPLTTHLHFWFLVGLACLFGISSLITGLCLASCLLMSIHTAVPPLLWLATSVSAVTIVVTGVIIVLYTSLVNGKKVPYAQWVMKPVNEYNQLLIPEFALQTVQDVEERCPAARFFVEELRLNEFTLDPLLSVISDTRKKYYLEVWNEPRFPKNRI